MDEGPQAMGAFGGLGCAGPASLGHSCRGDGTESIHIAAGGDDGPGGRIAGGRQGQPAGHPRSGGAGHHRFRGRGVDRADRDRFLAAYDDKIDFAPNEPNRVEVVLGHDNWPSPSPSCRSQKGWLFDTSAGKEEILNRRIGRNELYTIQVCEAYVEAQREYISADRELDGIMEYAQKVVSDPGKRNGLYWPVTEGEVPSPLGHWRRRPQPRGTSEVKSLFPFMGTITRFEGPGHERAGRGLQLRDQWSHGGRLCPGGLAGRLRRLRDHDVRGEWEWHRV